MDTYTIVSNDKPLFSDLHEHIIPDKELISVYKQNIIELKHQFKNTRIIALKLDIKKQIKFFENGVKYLENKYGKTD